MKFGKIFLSGNIENGDLEGVKKQLNLLGIEYIIQNNTISFEEDEVEKLPKDSKGHYLPVDKDNGFSIYQIVN